MFGSNNWGQLGLGSKVTVNKPTCVKGRSLNRSLLLVLVQKERALCGSAATDSCLQEWRGSQRRWRLLLPPQGAIVVTVAKETKISVKILPLSLYDIRRGRAPLTRALFPL